MIKKLTEQKLRTIIRNVLKEVVLDRRSIEVSKVEN